MRPTLRDYQQNAKQNIKEAFKAGQKRVVLRSEVGSGKCLGKGTPILMLDGSVKNVEDVVVGDLLMGPDSQPRTVLSLARGREMMYKVHQTNAMDYEVNESHILSVIYNGHVVNLSVIDFLARPKEFQIQAQGWKPNWAAFNRSCLTIEKLSEGDYYGFTIDGDRLFCLGDGTVTHNTVMFSDLAYDVVQKGNCVMVVCNRQKLVRQSANTLKRYGLNPYILMQRGLPPKGTPVIVASADTLRHREWPSWINMIIIDECHLASFTSVLEKAKDLGLYVLGVSATPIPNKSNRLHEFYNKMICTKPTIQHIIDGELVMDIYVKADTSVDTTGLSTHKTAYGYDYSSKDLFNLFDRPKIYDGMVNNYLKYAKFKKAVCFCASVEHSKKSAEAFRSHGIAAAHIDGSDPEEVREKIQADFEAGKYHVLCNCAIYTFGWDCPAVEVVIVNRATASYELWRQMIGRGARPFGTKEYFLVIDQGGNKDRHGSLAAEVEWNLDAPDRKKKAKKGVAPTKTCSNKQCGCLIPASATVCPVCKTTQPTTKAHDKPVEAEFILDIPDVISSTPAPIWPKREAYPTDAEFISACIDFAKAKNYHANFALNMVIKAANDEKEKIRLMHEYAKAKHYKQGWVFQNKQRYGVQTNS